MYLMCTQNKSRGAFLFLFVIVVVCLFCFLFFGGRWTSILYLSLCVYLKSVFVCVCGGGGGEMGLHFLPPPPQFHIASLKSCTLSYFLQYVLGHHTCYEVICFVLLVNKVMPFSHLYYTVNAFSTWAVFHKTFISTCSPPSNWNACVVINMHFNGMSLNLYSWPFCETHIL